MVSEAPEHENEISPPTLTLPKHQGSNNLGLTIGNERKRSGGALLPVVDVYYCPLISSSVLSLLSYIGLHMLLPRAIASQVSHATRPESHRWSSVCAFTEYQPPLPRIFSNSPSQRHGETTQKKVKCGVHFSLLTLETLRVCLLWVSACLTPVCSE